VDVFTRREYKGIDVASLRFCQENKGLRLFEWVLMSNHVHLVAAAQQGSSLSDIVRDLKKFTSGRSHRAIEENGGESRREWLMPLLREAGSRNSNNEGFQLWQQNNQPLLLGDPAGIARVVQYIRQNPVQEGLVEEAHEHVHSSAHEPGLLVLEER
jgi:REP element-mobilizing transposase RayT